jgi:hypothetical protein
MYGFNEAIESHSNWKLKLKQHIKEKLVLTQGVWEGQILDIKEVADHHLCELGQWIYGEGLCYHGLTAFEQMCSDHEHFHNAAADVIRVSNGGDASQALALLAHGGAFELASNKLVRSLIHCRNEILIQQTKPLYPEFLRAHL